MVNNFWTFHIECPFFQRLWECCVSQAGCAVSHWSQAAGGIARQTPLCRGLGHNGACDGVGSATGPAKDQSCQAKQHFSSLKLIGRDTRELGQNGCPGGWVWLFLPQAGVTAVPHVLLQHHCQPFHSSEIWNGQTGSGDTGLFSCPQQFAAVGNHHLQLHAFRESCIGKNLNRGWLILWQQVGSKMPAYQKI